jgi:cytochrome c oxidase cbb3-type subunit III
LSGFGSGDLIGSRGHSFSLMLFSPRFLSALVRTLLLAFAAGAFSQAPPQSAGARASKANPPQGKQVFASTCAGCHGLDGRGSERAPNIAERPSIQRLSDTQIARIIENGVPGTGMPAFHSLQDAQVKAVVGYLRTLQGARKTVSLPGDPERGKTIFFGKARCSSCHMVAGQGGFIASDLSDYASTHDVEQVRAAIVQPGAGNDTQARLAKATVRGGDTYVGRVRNEDNFSLQLQTLDGAFHLISKSDLERLEYDSQTLMPSDYGSTLSPAELNDVISFLMSAANAGRSGTAKKASDWEPL